MWPPQRLLEVETTVCLVVGPAHIKPRKPKEISSTTIWTPEKEYALVCSLESAFCVRWGKHDVEACSSPSSVKQTPVGSGGVCLVTSEGFDQGLLHTEDAVTCQIRVTFDEYVSHQGPETQCRHHEMEVGCSHW